MERARDGDGDGDGGRDGEVAATETRERGDGMVRGREMGCRRRGGLSGRPVRCDAVRCGAVRWTKASRDQLRTE